MKAACRFNSKLMDHVRTWIRPGLATLEIDEIVSDFTKRHGHRAATLGYLGYPKSCCVSVNDVICHGIPNAYRLRPGDIVNVDCATVVDGWHADQSETFFVGEVSDLARRVTQCAFDCMYAAIDAIKPGSRVSEIGEAVVSLAESQKFSVVREYVAHGLGRQFHEKPTISHVPSREGKKFRLEPGMCFTIEPMINTGSQHTKVDPRDGWTVRTKDGGLSAQFEHTILMTESGPEILTLTEHGPQRGRKF